MRMQSKICAEEDYLQAHLTAIKGKSRDTNPTLHPVKQRVTSVLKKWILGKRAMLPEGRNCRMGANSETIATGGYLNAQVLLINAYSTNGVLEPICRRMKPKE